MNKAIIAVVLVALAAAAGVWYTAQPRGSDLEQITLVLSEAQEAIESKSLTRALGYLSEDYEGAGGNKQQVGALMLNAFRNSDEVRVVLDTPQIRVQGSDADVQTRASLSATSAAGDSGRISYDTEAHFRLQKEDAKKYLVVPVRVWRIASAHFRMGDADLF